MVLSLQKLGTVLEGKGLIPKKYFTIGGMCVYLEVLAVETADIFFLYIPSKYDIVAPEDGKNVFKISSIDVNEDGTIAGDYAGELDNIELEKRYEEVDIDIDPTARTRENLEGQLEDNYNHPLSLKDVSKDDMKQLREIFRQLKRLRLCVQSLKYKLCITFKNYLCCIRRDDTFEGFTTVGLSGSDDRKFFVSIDLESMYHKLNTLAIDVKTVRQGVYRVLDKNHVKHTRNLKKILEHKQDFVTSSDFITKRKGELTMYLGDLERMLAELTKAERETIDRVGQINVRYSSDASLKGLHTDIEKSHMLAKYETRLSDIGGVRDEVTRNIFLVKGKLEDLSLKVDKVCFDNIVMLDAILKNFLDMTEF